MAGYIRGIYYNTRQSFKAATTQDGSSTSASHNGAAKTINAGATAWYIKHSQGAAVPMALCTTNNSWVDGWWPMDIMPRATYTVTLNHGGDSSNTGSLTKTWGISLSLPTPSRASTKSDGYKVTFSPGNGSANTSETQKNTTSYTFTNWSNGSSTYTSSYAPSEGDYAGPASNVTLTGNWSSSTSTGSVTLPTPTWANTTTSGTVTYNASANGGTSTKASDTVNLSVTHTFNGWYNGSTKVGNGGASYKPTANVTLTGNWTTTSTGSANITLPTASKANGTSSRTVTINANGGSSTVTSRKSSATVTYTSTGWWTQASGGSKVGNNGASITPSTAPITYYAQFSSSTGTYSTVTLPTATECTRTNYKLLGFATSSSATEATYNPGASYRPSGNVTLYAVWEELAGTVYVKVSGAWKEAKAVYTKVNGAWV